MATRTRQTGFWAFGRSPGRKKLRNAATLGLVALAPVLTLGTYVVMGPLDQGANSTALRLVLLADLVYILVVATLVLSQVARLIAARRAKSAGSRLHLRLTGVFALMALIPTVTVAVFAGLTVNIGIEGWFSDRVSQVVTASANTGESWRVPQKHVLSQCQQAVEGVVVSVDDDQVFVERNGEKKVLLEAPPMKFSPMAEGGCDNADRCKPVLPCVSPDGKHVALIRSTETRGVLSLELFTL